MNIQNRIKYFTYYGCNDPLRQRDNSPAADSKIDYIVNVLNRCGYSVDLISCAPSACRHSISGYVEKRGINTLRYFSSFGRKGRIWRKCNNLYMQMRFFLWCMVNIKRYEDVIVYHSLGYDAIFIKLFHLKHIHIIGEIEEIYQDVHKQRKKIAKNEYAFIDKCSKYMFPTTLLNEKLNATNKPVVVVHGVYSVEPIKEQKFDDGMVHVVYGGTLDPNKGGGAAAAAAAEFLPKNFHVHICGFGDPTQIKSIVADVSTRSKAVVTFEGELKGDEYKRFIQKCHIGLSTQNPNAAFNVTSFPSKILVYLSNGLKVVSIRIPVVEKSVVAECLSFYDEQTPQIIAKAIENAVDSGVDGTKTLEFLDNKLTEEFDGFIENRNNN